MPVFGDFFCRFAYLCIILAAPAETQELRSFEMSLLVKAVKEGSNKHLR
jgi:hypothetical protein